MANLGDSRAIVGRRRWTSPSGGRRRRRRTREEEEEEEGDDSAPPRSSSPYDAFRRRADDGGGDEEDEGERGRYVALDLTTDQCPSTPSERDRIHRHGGYVSPPGGPGNPSRVWADHNFTTVGLAMSRSFGDFNVKDLGVICDPVVTRYGVTTAGDLEREEERVTRGRGREGGRRRGPEGRGGPPGGGEEDRVEEEGEGGEEEAIWADEFLIVATDGVWEFISSAEAAAIVGRALDDGRGAREACAELIRAAVGLWKEHEGDYRDDVTAVVVRLDGLWGEDEDDDVDGGGDDGDR